MTRSEVHCLWWRWKATGCAEAREQLLQCNTRTIDVIASKYRHSLVPNAELMSRAYGGLDYALRTFDSERWRSLRLYAAYCIRAAILDLVIQYDQAQRCATVKPQSPDSMRLRRARARIVSLLGFQ